MNAVLFSVFVALLIKQTDFPQSCAQQSKGVNYLIVCLICLMRLFSLETKKVNFAPPLIFVFPEDFRDAFGNVGVPLDAPKVSTAEC